MRLLIDSHVLLWWMDAPAKLSTRAREAIADPANPVFVSSASLWELHLKASLGRLNFPATIVEWLEKDDMIELRVTWAHAERGRSLDFPHFDPFDRMLVAQCDHESLPSSPATGRFSTSPRPHHPGLSSMPAFVISLAALQRNTAILREVADAAGCQLVLALKGFSCWKAFPYLRDDLDGCCASGLWEALLARDHFGTNTSSPTRRPISEDEIAELCEFTHHLDFNSLSAVVPLPRAGDGAPALQERRAPLRPAHQPGVLDRQHPALRPLRARLPPRHHRRPTRQAPTSTASPASISTPSASRTPTTSKPPSPPSMRNSATSSARRSSPTSTWAAATGSPSRSTTASGSSAWSARPAEKYDVEVWLEPGEAVAIHTGVLRATVLDVFESAGHRHAILDVSATAHMPDVLEMPYRPEVFLVDRSTEVSTDAKSQPVPPSPSRAELLATPTSDPASRVTFAGNPPSPSIHNPDSSTASAARPASPAT